MRCSGKFVRLAHPLVSRVVAPFRRNLDNLLSGLKERVYYIDATGTRPPLFTGNLQGLKGMARLMASFVPPQGRRVMSADSYVKTRPSRTRRLYQQALDEIKRGEYTLRKWAVTGLFTKTEKTQQASLYTWTETLKTQVPRIINPRKPHYNILLGKRLHPIEAEIFGAMQRCNGQPYPAVAKGLTSAEKADAIVSNIREGFVAIGLDASRFDQSIRRELLTVEHAVYKSLLKGDKELEQLLSLQLDNFGATSNKHFSLKCKYGAIRCSGDVNTSLGNCIIFYVIVEDFIKAIGIREHRVFLDGDDLLLFVRPYDVKKVVGTYQQHYITYGLRMKLDCVSDYPEGVEFCQARPVFNGANWTLCRDPIKVLNCDYCGYDQCMQWKYYRGLLRNVGLCGMEYARGIPVLQEFYQFGIREGRSAKMSAELQHSGMRIAVALAQKRGTYNSKPAEVASEARVSFSKAFGISPDKQIELENHIKRWKMGTRTVMFEETHIRQTNNKPLYRDLIL